MITVIGMLTPQLPTMVWYSASNGSVKTSKPPRM